MFPNTSAVYVLTSPSGKRYVGKSVNLRERLRAYERKHANVKKQPALWKALCKYPWDQWTVEYELKPVDALDDAEIATIARYNTYHGPGYNLTKGGDGISGVKLSAAHRAKISAASRGRTHSADTRAKIGAASKGRKCSAATRAKLSAANKGYKHSAESRRKMSASHTGKKLSAETIAKCSLARKGKPRSAATRAKISAKLKGRTLSDETRAKLSAVRKGKKRSAESIAKRTATRKRNRMLRDLLMMV